MPGNSAMYMPLPIQCHQDELFFSICNRAWHRAGVSSSNAFARQLHLAEASSYYMLRRAPQGLKVLSQVVDVDLLSLLQRHTLIPYYEAVSPRPLAQSELEALVTGPHANSRYRINSWRRQPLQFCVQCLFDDQTALGEPIWRRSHQLPGVKVCLRHRAWLAHSCGKCGWAPSARRLGYPLRACPNGHALTSEKPAASLDLNVELTFAKWSCELLNYRVGDRRAPLVWILRDMASRKKVPRWSRHGEPDERPADAHVAGLRNVVIANARQLVARVSNAPYCHVLAPALRSHNGLRPHPVAVVLCVKALMGPTKNALEALLEHQPRNLNAEQQTWAERYRSLPRRATGQREALLIDFLVNRAQFQPGESISCFETALGAELGLSRESISRWKRVLPAFGKSLAACRPDVYC